MDVITELIGVPAGRPRRGAPPVRPPRPPRGGRWTTCRPAGVEAAFSLVAYYADMLAERRATPTDDLTSALLGGRGRRRPAHRRRDHRLPVPHGRRRQRDHHQAPRQRLVLGVAQPRRAGQAVRRPRPRSRRGSRRRCATTRRARCSPASPPRTSSCTATVIPAGDRVVLLVGSANRDERVFADPDRYDLDRPERELQQIASFGFGRHFCLGASLARLEARVVPRGAGGPRRRLRHRPGGHPPRALRQRARLRRPPHDGGGRADAPVRAASRAPGRRRHRRVVRARAGHRAGAGRGRPPRRARRPAARPARGGGRQDRAPTAARPSALAARPHRRRVHRRVRRRRRGADGPDRDRRRRTPATCCPATALGVDPGGLHPAGAGEPPRRPPPRAPPRPADGRAPARRHRVRHDRRRAGAAHLHGRLRHVEERPRGPRPRDADGARGHRRARRHRAPRPVDHRAGHHLERGTPSTR